MVVKTPREVKDETASPGLRKMEIFSVLGKNFQKSTAPYAKGKL
jgi:hypothetical protein